MFQILNVDAATLLVNRGLTLHDPELEKHIGKNIRFKDWTPGMGAAKRDYSFKIIGVQRIYDGQHAYRVTCNGFNDTFGCPALPDAIEFVQ